MKKLGEHGHLIIALRLKYKMAQHGRFKAHYDHQPGVTFKDEQGKLHLVPNKKPLRRQVSSGTSIGDLRRSNL